MRFRNNQVERAPLDRKTTVLKAARHRSIRALLIILGLIVLGVIGTLALSPKARLGLVIIRYKATGTLPDVGWLDLWAMIRSGKHFHLPELASIPDPYAVIRSPYTSSADLSAGRAIFESHCIACHGANGKGGNGGPALQHRRMVQGGSDWAIFRTISFGIPGTGMPASHLPWVDRWRLVGYVTSLVAGTSSETRSASLRQIDAPSIRDSMLVNAAQQPSDWLMYSGTYSSHRFSFNQQITRANVSGLRLLWVRQYNIPSPTIETSPIVTHGFMFLTVPPNRVEALDASTGALIWAYDRSLPDHMSLCCGVLNRGLAVLGNTLYLGTLDAHLVALDIHSGSLLWDVPIADYKAGYTITGAPLAVKNLIVTGVAGGEFGIRGFIDARDANTGKEVWRFDTIAQKGQDGASAWTQSAARTGGGPTWLTGSFDPSTNLIYWPTGNPSPDYDPSVRPADNLYTNTMLALDADRGTLRWYFQFTPHDAFDWDSTEIPVLLDGSFGGRKRHLVAQANRNGFFYLLDAETGQFLLAKPFAKQTWAKGIDAHGRPEPIPGAVPSQKGTAIFPGDDGATNWQSPSYSPDTRLMYVPLIDRGATFSLVHAAYREGVAFNGGFAEPFPESTSEVAVRAIDPITGSTAWEYRNPGTSFGGLLSTAGGLVFGSQGETFFALDAATGKELWRVEMGANITAAPVTFSCNGKQRITIAAGRDILTFGL